ncbi:hypothetical protein BGY98DRAFT_584590 [Russula aff. rugulosa BPL654]|nr:hypothetical protein BGY98DRAFT_584590 [Russula aff. rugulosa BPL654]
MPFRRCRNFESNGSRKTWPNGSEVSCAPNCQFIHPSDPDWDRAPAIPIRGRGGHPQGGRGRGQSSFGPPASGANASAMGPERGSSSGTWNDYMTGFDRNPRATSGSRGAPSHRSGQSRPENSGWGSSGADGPGWGSSTKNNENLSNGWSNEPGAAGEQASSSQWDTQAGGWGSSGDGWGSSGNGPGPSGDGWGSSGNGLESSGNAWGSSGNALESSGNAWGSPGNALESSGNAWGSSGNALESSGNGWGSSGNDLGSGGGWGSAGADQGPGWGETSISDQGSKAPSARAVAKTAEPDAVLGGTGVDGNSDAAVATTRSSRVSPAVAPASQTDIQESGGAKKVVVVVRTHLSQRHLWLTNRSKCNHRISTTAIISLRHYRTPTIWDSR